MNAPLLIPFCGVVGGILLSSAGVDTEWSAAFIAAACALYAALITLSSNPVRAYKLSIYHNVWVFLLFVGIGVYTSGIHRPDILDSPSSYVSAEGRILTVAQSTSGDRVVLDIERLFSEDGKCHIPDKMKLLVRSDALSVTTDDEVALPVQLKEIVDSDDHFRTGYAQNMHRKGIFYETVVPSENVIVTGHTRTFGGTAVMLRERLETLIEKTSLSKQTQNFLITVLLGDRSYLDEASRNLFADAGISHILALSGMHIAIICGLLLWILFPLNFFGLYKLRLGLSALAMFGYAFLTGWNPSTVRASLMLALLVTCIIIERKNTAWNSLLGATLIILIFSPEAIADVGLQLSFVSVASLIFFANRLNPFSRHEHPLLFKISAFAIASLVAVCGTWCLSAYYFGSVPVMFLPANILIVPCLPVYLFLAIIYLFLHGINIEFSILGQLLDTVRSGATGLIGQFTSGGSSSIDFSPTLLTLVLWIVFIAIAAMIVNGHRKKIYHISCGISLTLFVVSVAFPLSSAETTDSFIVQHGIGPVTIAMNNNGNEKQLSFRRQAVSEANIYGQRIAVLDAALDNMPAKTVTRYDELIIAGGCRDSLSKILKKLPAARIIIHQTVRRKREAELIREADSLGIECHSIRNQGAYRR